MRKKVGAVVNCIWAVLVLLTGTADCMRGYLKTEAYTSDICMASVEPFLYAADNTDGTTKLYRIDESGEISRTAEADGAGENNRCAQIAAGENVYVLMEGEYAENGETGYQYRIAKYTQELQWISHTGQIRFEETGRVTGFSVDDGGYYLTVVDGDGVSASAYRIAAAEETEASDEETQPVTAEEVTVTVADSGRTILQARYQRGKMLLYLDDGTGAAYFTPDEAEIARFNDRQFTLKQYLGCHMELLFRYIVILFAGLLLLIVMENILQRKNRLVCLIAMLEAALLFVIAGGVYFLYATEYDRETEKCAELAEVYLKSLAQEAAFQEPFSADGGEYYDSEKYYGQFYAMRKLTYGNGVSAYFKEVCLVYAGDGTVVAGSGFRNGQPISTAYSDAAAKLCTAVSEKQRYASAKVRQGNTEVYIGCAPTGEDGYVLTGILKAAGTRVGWRKVLIRDSLAGLGIYIVLSALGIAFLTMQSRDIGKLKKEMLRVAGGGQEISRPTVHGKDMESMWNSIREADKALKKLNYRRLQTFEAYYRFAPKEIETLLDKRSILEVACGDERMLEGIMAIVENRPAGEGIASGSRFLELLEGHRQEQGGVIVSNDARLSVLKLLFPSGKGDTVRFATELIRDSVEEGNPVTVFLFHSRFLYGIAGTEAQCFPYLDIKNQFRQDEYAGWLGRMGLRVVVTDAVRESGCADRDVRYLGYVSTDEGKVKLYEVLDACPNRERMAKLRTKEKFEQALQLFYQHDFYLARSAFSEMLREFPEDRIAKWYLFTCEKHLNEVHGEDIDCGLHCD